MEGSATRKMSYSYNQSLPPPPPPPPSSSHTNQKSPINPNRRELFQSSSRMRTASSGSTRGAFGLMPVDASAHNPHDIYQKQLEAKKKGQDNTEDGYDRSASARTDGMDNFDSRAMKKIGNASTTPGQTINRMSGNYNDEEWGPNYGGATSSAGRNVNSVLNHDPLPNHPRSRKKQAYQSSSNNYSQQPKDQSYSWQNLPQPPNQYGQVSRSSYGESFQSSLNYSYRNSTDMGPSGVMENPSSTIRTTDADKYFLQSGRYYANQIGKGKPPGPLIINQPDIGEKSLDSGSTYSTEYEEEQLTWYQYLVYHSQEPEFTSVQQYFWSTFIGILMGFFTAFWGELIEWCVEFTWKTAPEHLLEWGVFTDLEGSRPLPYYFVACPAVFGGVSSFTSFHYAPLFLFAFLLNLTMDTHTITAFIILHSSYDHSKGSRTKRVDRVSSQNWHHGPYHVFPRSHLLNIGYGLWVISGS